jgi:hypothetical protein
VTLKAFKIIFLLSLCAFFRIGITFAFNTDAKEFYRELVLNIRKTGDFELAVPMAEKTAISQTFEWLDPLPEIGEPIDFPIDPLAFGGTDKFYRIFFDRILFKDGSYISIGEEKLPLTCLFVEGQDNRFSGKDTPEIPEILLKIYLVANDFSCTGPLNPGWPGNGMRKENWDTFLYYEVRDPTIMLPVEARLRYRWNEFAIVRKEKR